MAATLLRADRPPALVADPLTVSASSTHEGANALTEAVLRVIADGQPRTHDQIADALGGVATASAIADEIERLRDYGMRIEDGAGAVVTAPFVPLDHAALAAALADIGAAEWAAEVVFATRSTNSDLLAEVRARAPDGPVLRAAEHQLAGRGRLGRRWSSAPGTSLTASFALTLRRRLSALDGATLVCGLAVHDVLGALGVQTRLKWPNDVLFDGGKLAGILVEAHATGESSVLVIGVGINVVGRSGDGGEGAAAGALRRTTLEEAGVRVDRNLLAARLARSLEAHMAAFETDGFRAFVARWNAVDAFAGRSVTLEVDRGTRRTGVACGVDDDGALRVDVDGRRQRIVAGDVSLRAADGALA